MAGARVIVFAAITMAAANLPVFLVGALVVLVRGDFAFSESQLGLAVSAYFASAVLLSVPGGKLVDRLGPQRSLRLAIGLSLLALVGLAVVARSPVQVALVLLVAGVGAAVAEPASNAALAAGIGAGRRGRAFGLKQASVPAATLLAGALVPLVGVTLGWRWGFGLPAAGLLLFLLLVRHQEPGGLPSRGRREPTGPPGPLSMIPLSIMAAGAGLGLVAASVLSSFYVDYAVSTGLSAATAGMWLSVGGVSGIVGRIGLGLLSDRAPMDSCALTSLVMAIGACGFFVMAVPGAALLLAVATVTCFAIGWGWNGLFHMTVVELNEHAPASATGVTALGMRIGGIVGPLAFGQMLQTYSYPVAWRAAGVSLLGGACLVWLGGRLLSTPSTAARPGSAQR